MNVHAIAMEITSSRSTLKWHCWHAKCEAMLQRAVASAAAAAATAAAETVGELAKRNSGTPSNLIVCMREQCLF